MPGVELRFCVRHFYANCKKAYEGGTLLRDLILPIAKATYVEERERRIKQLESIKERKRKRDTSQGVEVEASKGEGS